MDERLSKRENAVMGAVFALSQGKERFLVSPYELLALLPEKFDEQSLERALFSLELGGYFEVVFSERKGEKTYCIRMKEEGLCFRRTDRMRKRTLLLRLVYAALCGVLSALVGVLVKLLLS